MSVILFCSLSFNDIWTLHIFRRFTSYFYITIVSCILVMWCEHIFIFICITSWLIFLLESNRATVFFFVPFIVQPDKLIPWVNTRRVLQYLQVKDTNMCQLNLKFHHFKCIHTNPCGWNWNISSLHNFNSRSHKPATICLQLLSIRIWVCQHWTWQHWWWLVNLLRVY